MAELFIKELKVEENGTFTGKILDDVKVEEEIKKREGKSYGFFRTIWSVIYVAYWHTIGYYHDPEYSTKIRHITGIAARQS